MNKTLSFIRLDFITVKPYFTLKNLFIFCAVALIMMISSGSSISAIAMLMVYAALYVSYPFAVGEQNGIDALYTTLSIKRSTVVLGRYLFSLIIDVCAGLLAFVFTSVVLAVMQKDFNALESLLATIVMFLLYSFVQAVQLPIYFKLGYAKAKVLAYLPFIGLALITLLVTDLMKDSPSTSLLNDLLGWFSANPIIAASFGVIAMLGVVIISYKVSLSYYNKRDF